MTDEVNMVPNNAGGLTFAVSAKDRLERFLILGSDSNTYYQNGAALAKDNAKHVIQMLRTEPKLVVDTVIAVSQAGRAPKNEYALFVLALAASDTNAETRKLAFAALPQVARTGTHLFNFVEYAEQFRGWGKAMRKAISKWYTEKSVDQLAYQVVKYQSRGKWSNRDLLRKAHPVAKSDEFDAVFRWIVGGPDALKAGTHNGGNDKANPKVFDRKDVQLALPNVIKAFEEAKTATAPQLIKLITKDNLPREGVPTEMLTRPDVWEALLEKMPMEAMMRNLSTMTRNGLLADKSNAEKVVLERLASMELITKARLHPMKVLMALSTYAAGRGVLGKSVWTPLKSVTDALDAAFYLSFGNVVPSGKKSLLGLDVSGSMDGARVNGFVNLSAREASMAMAMVTVRSEPETRIIAFTTGGFTGNGNTAGYHRSSVKEIFIDKNEDLRTIIDRVRKMPFSGTDVSLPMRWATSEKYEAEAFSVYTDNETYQPHDSASTEIKKFRKRFNVPAKLAVFGTTATQFTVADPNDAGMMDFVGFDSGAPEMAARFFAS